jgi:hypothetical protein
MSDMYGLGIFKPTRPHAASSNPRLVVADRPLRQVLAFTRRSIHDIVNCEIAKREVLGYYKLKCDIHRRCEATDLERWWTGANSSPH